MTAHEITEETLETVLWNLDRGYSHLIAFTGPGTEARGCFTKAFLANHPDYHVAAISNSEGGYGVDAWETQGYAGMMEALADLKTVCIPYLRRASTLVMVAGLGGTIIRVEDPSAPRTLNESVAIQGWDRYDMVVTLDESSLSSAVAMVESFLS